MEGEFDGRRSHGRIGKAFQYKNIKSCASTKPIIVYMRYISFSIMTDPEYPSFFRFELLSSERRYWSRLEEPISYLHSPEWS